MAGELPTLDPVEMRFWAKVDMLGDCWEWRAARHRYGYGKLTAGGRTYSAHRVAYGYANGTAPGSLLIRHSCDNPPCVNPAHLIPGTSADNTRDMFDRGRHGRPAAIGERNSHAKLTAADVIRVRERFAAGETIRALAVEHCMNVSVVSEIVNGKRWAHVGGPIRTPGQLGRRPKPRG